MKKFIHLTVIHNGDEMEVAFNPDYIITIESANSFPGKSYIYTSKGEHYLVDMEVKQLMEKFNQMNKS